jgi:Asparagine synthase (glutamine-hydrolyzing)
MTYLDLKFRLPELLLMRVDKMSMGVSLEGRVPFLDHEFVETVMGIPVEQRVQINKPKEILKGSIRGLIPDEIIDRKKQGFGVPISEWLLEKLGEQFEKDLTEFCRETDFFDYDYILNLKNENRSSLLFNIYNFILWWKTFIKK